MGEAECEEGVVLDLGDAPGGWPTPGCGRGEIAPGSSFGAMLELDLRA